MYRDNNKYTPCYASFSITNLLTKRCFHKVWRFWQSLSHRHLSFQISLDNPVLSGFRWYRCYPCYYQWAISVDTIDNVVINNAGHPWQGCVSETPAEACSVVLCGLFVCVTLSQNHALIDLSVLVGNLPAYPIVLLPPWTSPTGLKRFPDLQGTRLSG